MNNSYKNLTDLKSKKRRLLRLLSKLDSTNEDGAKSVSSISSSALGGDLLIDMKSFIIY